MNKLITPEQIINEVLASMDGHGIPKLFAEASPEDRREMLRLLSNMFDGRFPSCDDIPERE